MFEHIEAYGSFRRSAIENYFVVPVMSTAGSPHVLPYLITNGHHKLNPIGHRRTTTTRHRLLSRTAISVFVTLIAKCRETCNNLFLTVLYLGCDMACPPTVFHLRRSSRWHRV